MVFFTTIQLNYYAKPFHEWLSQTVWSGKDDNDEVKWLSQCPNRVVKRYSAFIINGFSHTKYLERLRRTQNFGIVVNSSITSYASARNSNPVEGNVEYYRLPTDIIELDYYGKWKIVLFRCDWADVNAARGIKNNQFGFTMNTLNSEEENSEQQTVTGSSNVPETPDELAEFQIESGGTRRGQGRTLLKDLYDLNPIERVKPVGSEARLLASYLGIVAQNANILPINYKSWHHIPDSNKNQALDNIKEKFALEVLDDYIKKTLGKKWRDHKSTLKKEYFKKNIRLKVKLQNVPLGMLSSRQKQKFTHTTGSRSFASVVKAEEVSSGQKVGRLQLFEITHKKKDGSPMTSEAGEIMEKLKDKKVEYEAIALTDSFVNLENIDNKIITEVLGLERYDWVRFQGSGVTPTQYFGSSSQQNMPSGSQAQAEVQRLRDQIAQMQVSTVEQIVEVHRKYEELHQQFRADAAAREAEVATMAAEQSRKYDELQLQLQHMMKMFQQPQKLPS
ncbi:hypothetical protein PVK06_021134 [Gossypium arboreum]|uniref:DUF4216 domain-containing protein n=1 Tax=Gossypium arboreum TaxID=29729 RepID=A0ABR0PP65_GOSAR|nr:hypothetical protein PVK06_021134 [Gossypium arboreum]